MANTMLHTKAEVLRENINTEQGVIDAVVGSSNVLDRMGDIISQNGWDLKHYKNNPVILWGHNMQEERPPIGKALKVWIEDKASKAAKLMFKVKFDLQDSFAAEIFRKVKEGFISTVSVGFLPTEWEELDPNKGPFGGHKFIKQELLELSFVPVPANPEAIVALRSMNDKRFAPVELEEVFPQVGEEVAKELVEKPFENEHACRLIDPDMCQEDSFRRMKRKHEGKEYSVIMAKKNGEDTMSDQSFRYPKDTWESSEAGSHCKSHGGTFEPAKKEQLILMDKENEVVETTTPPNQPSTTTTTNGDAPVVTAPVVDPNATVVSTPVEPVTPVDVPVVPTEPVVTPTATGTDVPGVPETPATNDSTPLEPPKETADGVDGEEDMSLYKGVIPFKDLDTVPETEGWDGPGELAKAGIEDLKVICAWGDREKAEDKGSYKLPHHKAEGHKAVWRGVAASMATLLGAKGGVEIPEEDRKGVYNHLKKHYVQFGKEIPDFKMVEEQVLAKLDQEVFALTLDREDKHAVKLIKKVIEKQKESQYTTEQIVKALEVLNTALSLLKSDPKGGGD